MCRLKGVGGWGVYHVIFAHCNCANMAGGGVPKATFHIFVKICNKFFLMGSLSSKQISVRYICTLVLNMKFIYNI